MLIRDARTKTGWSRIEQNGPGPRTEPEQEQQNLDILDRARTRKILVILNQLGPGPNKLKIGPTRTETINFQRYGTRTFQNLRPDRTRTKKHFKTSDWIGPGPTKISKSRTGPGPTKFWKKNGLNWISFTNRWNLNIYLFVSFNWIFKNLGKGFK